MMRALASAAMIAGITFFAVAHTRVHAQARAPVQLRAGDAIRVEIKDEPKLSGDFPVGVDGAVLLPTLGTHRVAQRPFGEVERELLGAYTKELVNPVIRLTPLVRVAVLGEVRQPGLLLIDPTFTLGDILAQAGGLMSTANLKKIELQRLDGTAISFSFQHPPADVKVESGDKVVVSRRSWASEHLGVLIGAAGSIGVAFITGALLR